MNRLLVTFWFLLLPGLALAWMAPDAPQSDPVLCLWFTQSQIAFERAPPWLALACTEPNFDRMWIFAETRRPHGTYMLVSGTFWMDEDYPTSVPHKPVEEYYGDGEIILVPNNHSCDGLWSADNTFNNYFPENVNDKLPSAPATSLFAKATDGPPTAAEASIIRDLGIDLIRRDEQALGGRQAFLRALDATGHKDTDQDAVMIPLLQAVRRGH